MCSLKTLVAFYSQSKILAITWLWPVLLCRAKKFITKSLHTFATRAKAFIPTNLTQTLRQLQTLVNSMVAIHFYKEGKINSKCGIYEHCLSGQISFVDKVCSKTNVFKSKQMWHLPQFSFTFDTYVNPFFRPVRRRHDKHEKRKRCATPDTKNH